MAGKVDKSKKLEPVPKPDEKLYRDRIQAETAAIDELRAKINELQQKISAVIGGREEYNMEKQNRQARLDALQKEIDQLEEQRKVLFEKIQSKQKEGAEMKQSATDLRRKIGFASVEDIDQKIAALEHNMMTSTLSLKEEKQFLEEIKRLKSSKPLLSKYQALEQSASSLEDTSVVPLRAMLDEVRTKLLELRTQKREESQKYKELLERRQKATAPGREMIEERERLSAEMNKHFVNMQKHQAYMQQVKRERGLKLREERERRNLENERMQLSRDLERVESELPFEAECLLLSQTIQFLQKILEEPASSSTEKGPAEEPVDEKLAGALLPKSQRKEVFFYAPKTKGKQPKDLERKKERPKTLKYDVGTLAYFEQCGLTAPVLMEEVPTCLEKLEAKLKNFKELQHESAQKVDERKAEILAKIQTVNEKITALMKKEEKAQDDREGETAADGSPTAEEADDE
ncbi:YALI0F04037p, related [Eimeria tenella]|uniref:YALI0F04037p, related n=1 Tax=Eimeria tenella TaxID=5802 RepID=U6KWP0_EIMTE|nr:YALI0F04037p, related [Eimeria tenella]CDJ42542.1 YALI0F04037p, related [Eimeria tenella]|eukprot:XP_013233292.1 YALI0F04037p, related [Eimeria tenella]